MSNSFKLCPTHFCRGGRCPRLRACHTLSWHKWTYSRTAKTSHEHVLLVVFNDFIEMGRAYSLFLILTNLLCFPWNKNWLSS